ncbi:MAG: FAD-dependent oxidoreductase [Fimbriimonadaceae bacterium]|nr:FAD-dependent oxidoreductase [Fimbriimonadaceae bacterium]
MRVAVVGAGIAGLAAARRLTQAGKSVVVFERSRGLGGRCATRRVGDYTFDHGATSVAPRGTAIEDVLLNQLATTDLVEVAKPTWTHSSGRLGPGDSRGQLRRFCYRKGLNTLGKLLAGGLDVRKSVKVEGLERQGSGYRVEGEEFDAVVLTPPLPQTTVLLDSLGESRQFDKVFYRSCISVMLGYRAPLDPPFFASLDAEQSTPLAWLSIESAKCPGDRAPEGCTAVVAQMSAAYSKWNLDRPDDKVVNDTLVDVERLLGPAFKSPEVVDVHRWRYSQPETTVAFDSVNRPGATLLIAGDGVAQGRIEHAYESGLAAAERLIGDNP